MYELASEREILLHKVCIKILKKNALTNKYNMTMRYQEKIFLLCKDMILCLEFLVWSWVKIDLEHLEEG